VFAHGFRVCVLFISLLSQAPAGAVPGRVERSSDGFRLILVVDREHGGAPFPELVERGRPVLGAPSVLGLGEARCGGGCLASGCVWILCLCEGRARQGGPCGSYAAFTSRMLSILGCIIDASIRYWYI